MVDAEKRTTVVIVGAGVAGLTVGNLLRRNGIDCIILERRKRAHVEAWQRAGTLDTRGVRLCRLARSTSAEVAGDGWSRASDLCGQCVENRGMLREAPTRVIR